MMSRIKQLAQKQGYEKPEHLSRKVGLTRSTLYNVWEGEIGHRQFATMFLIARALGVAMEELFVNERAGGDDG